MQNIGNSKKLLLIKKPLKNNTKEIEDTRTKQIKDLRGFENFVFKQTKNGEENNNDS